MSRSSLRNSPPHSKYSSPFEETSLLPPQTAVDTPLTHISYPQNVLLWQCNIFRSFFASFTFLSLPPKQGTHLASRIPPAFLPKCSFPPHHSYPALNEPNHLSSLPSTFILLSATNTHPLTSQTVLLLPKHLKQLSSPTYTSPNQAIIAVCHFPTLKNYCKNTNICSPNT